MVGNNAQCIDNKVAVLKGEIWRSSRGAAAVKRRSPKKRTPTDNGSASRSA